MPMIFYDCSTAPSPRRARIVLAEKNVPHDVINIDMTKGEQMSPAFLDINPGQTIPALKLDNGHVLTDNAGIAAYLEAEYPDPPLLGRSSIEKAKIASWQSRIESGFAMAIANAFRNSHPTMKGRALPGPENYEQIPELAERGLAQIEAFFRTLESHLINRQFIVGDQLSIADITAGVTMDFARVVGKKPGDEMPNINRWHRGLKARPSFSL